MILALALQELFPDANFDTDFIVADDGEGDGAYILDWNLSDPRPSEAQIEMAWLQVELRRLEEEMALTGLKKAASDARDLHEAMKGEVWSESAVIAVLRGALERIDYLETLL